MNRWRSKIGLSLLTVTTFIFGTHVDANEPVLVIQTYRAFPDDGFDPSSPVFVAYTDGTIIWAKNWDAPRGIYLSKRANKADEVVGGLRIQAAKLAGKEYKLTSGTDARGTIIWTAAGAVTIYGNWKAPSKLPEDRENTAYPQDNKKLNALEESLWATLPTELRAELERLESFNASDAQPWKSERLRVIFSPARAFSPTARDWPKDWPTPRSVVESSRVSFSEVELSSKYFEELLKLAFSNDGQQQTVRVNGQPFFMEMAFIFPGEQRWKVNLANQPTHK